MSGTSLAPGGGGAPGEVVAGLRAANAQLRELPGGKGARIAALGEQVTRLQARLADLAARVRQNSKNSGKPPPSGGLAKPAPKSLRKKKTIRVDPHEPAQRAIRRSIRGLTHRRRSAIPRAEQGC